MCYIQGEIFFYSFENYEFALGSCSVFALISDLAFLKLLAVWNTQVKQTIVLFIDLWGRAQEIISNKGFLVDRIQNPILKTIRKKISISVMIVDLYDPWNPAPNTTIPRLQ